MKWQISNGKIEDAVQQIKRAARANGVILNDEQLKPMMEQNFVSFI